MDALNPRSGKSEARRSVSLRSARFIEKVPGRPSLDCEGNFQKQKEGEGVIEGVGRILASVSSRTW